MGKILWPLKYLHFNRIFFILAGNEDNHKVSNKFEIWPDPIADGGASCPVASGKIPID